VDAGAQIGGVLPNKERQQEDAFSFVVIFVPI
jgi:hypothetical protein